MLVRDIMTQNVITVEPSATVSEAAELMRQYDIGILPVVEGESVVGVITDRDIVTRGVAQNKMSASVSECMSKSTVWANPTQNISSAAKTMAAQQIRRVPVMENGSLCGILSLSDILRNGYEAEIANTLCEISKP